MLSKKDESLIQSFLREIGRYQLKGYRQMQHAAIRVKETSSYGQSVVTRYDVETERRVSRFIKEHFPGDSFLGEELGNVTRDPARYWVLDPIDGTTNFTQSVAYWGPSLAFVEGRRIQAGWIYFPAIDELFHARRGGGAYLNGSRIHSSGVTRYSDLSSVATTSRGHRRFRLIVPAKHRILGSLIANLAYLATGTFAAVYCRAHVWDVAAGILIAREAGAVVECRPEIEDLDLASLDPRAPTSYLILGRANKKLQSLEEFLRPVRWGKNRP
jgi:myo-inositol-1(or 4)-monophosphatase